MNMIRATLAGFKNKAHAKEALLEDVSLLAEAQSVLWASQEYSVLIIFQAMGRGRQGRQHQTCDVRRQSAGRRCD